jgi:hypothetical protein
VEFDILRSKYGYSHIIPHNPKQGAGDGFEGFRQSMNAVTRLAGSWPTDLKVVAREHVEFWWAEHLDSVPSFNYLTFENDWTDRLDVSEYAYYVGPLTIADIPEIDINAVFKVPEKLEAVVDSTQKE